MFGKRKQHEEALRTEPVEVLADWARTAVRSERWERLEAGVALLREGESTEQALLDALEALLQALVLDDQAAGRSGRDSGYFEFYDQGLAAMCEALRDRLGLPQPWDETSSDPDRRGPYR